MFTTFALDAPPGAPVDGTAPGQFAQPSARAGAVPALVESRHPTPVSRLLAARATPRLDCYWVIEPATHELQMVCEAY
jgi:hypothetical protein